MKDYLKNKKVLFIIILGLILIASFSLFPVFRKGPLEKARNLSTNDIYDVVLFWGQSNMVGYCGVYTCSNSIDETDKDARVQAYGVDNFSKLSKIDKDIIQNYSKMNHVNVDIKPGTVYDYSYLSNSLVEINKNTQAVGEKIGVSVKNGSPVFSQYQSGAYSIQRSYGTNVIPYFSKVHYEKTGHKVIVVMAANGGEEIAHFLPHARVLQLSLSSDSSDKNQYIYEMMTKKYKAAINYLESKNLTVGNKFYVAFQGEADVSYAQNGKTSKKRYVDTFKEVHNTLKKDLDLEFGTIIETSHTIGGSRLKGVEIIHDAQEELIKNNNDIILGSSYSYDTYVPSYTDYITKYPNVSKSSYESLKKNALLGTSITNCYENTIHFTSAALSQIGKESATNSAKFISNSKMKVNFYKNDGTDTVATQEFKYGVLGNRFGYNTDGSFKWGNSGQFGNWDYPGYKLLGWSWEKNAKEETYSAYAHVIGRWITTNMPTANLYAVWSAKKVTVTYMKNSSPGDTSSASQTFTAGVKNQNFGKTDGKCNYANCYSDGFGNWRKEGYKLLGWSLKEDSSSSSWSSYSGVVDSWIGATSPKVTLYAVWKPNKYQIKYNSNGGTGSMNNTSCTYDSNCKLLDNNFKREGYKFIGWATSPSGSVKYNNSTSVKNLVTDNDSIINLYAIWEKNTSISVEEYLKGYTIENNHIFVPLNTKVNSFGASNNYTFKVKTKSSSYRESGNLCTGDLLEVYLNNNKYKSYVIVVKGDITGDGKIDISDVAKLYQFFKGKIKMDLEYQNAGKIVNSKSITIADIAKLYQYVKGKVKDL